MTTSRRASSHELPPARSVLAICAHPDDESFGLGALLDRFAERGTDVAVLCFTKGEASTLGIPGPALGELRRAELAAAAAELGVARVVLLDQPDGSLSSVPLDELAAAVTTMADEVNADLLVVFDAGGVTGHPDHSRATDAALVGAPALPALGWVVPCQVAAALNSELGTSFVGRSDDEIDVVLPVDRDRQRRAIARHESQCTANAVLERRLALLGDTESMRWLRPPRRGRDVPETAAPASPPERRGADEHTGT